MLTFLFAAASATMAQPQATPPASPQVATYIIYGDYGAPGRPGNIERLLEEWRRDGVIRGSIRRAPNAEAAPCVGRRHYDPTDRECIRRLNPPGAGQPPVVAIVARDSGRIIPVYNIACIGPVGHGSASINMNTGGAFSAAGGQRSESRSGMLNCIGAALPGAARRSVAAALGFTTSTGRTGDFFYHQLSADCDLLQHRIGRNATRGSYWVPLQAARLSLESPRRVRFDCLQGACVSATLQGQTRTMARHAISFETEAGAARYMEDVEALKRACRR
jgi:hypothetical protein